MSNSDFRTQLVNKPLNNCTVALSISQANTSLCSPSRRLIRGRQLVLVFSIKISYILGLSFVSLEGT